jgi:hypothetical protein
VTSGISYPQYQFGTSYIENILKLLQIRAREDLKVLHEPIDRKAWGDTAPSVVNAFYEPSRNQISTRNHRTSLERHIDSFQLFPLAFFRNLSSIKMLPSKFVVGSVDL